MGVGYTVGFLWLVGRIRVHVQMGSAARLLLGDIYCLRFLKAPYSTMRQINQGNDLGWRVFREPPIKGCFTLAAARFGSQVCLDLNRPRSLCIGRVGDKIDATVCCHRRRLDSEDEQFVLDERLAGTADSGVGELRRW